MLAQSKLITCSARAVSVCFYAQSAYAPTEVVCLWNSQWDSRCAHIDSHANCRIAALKKNK